MDEKPSYKTSTLSQMAVGSLLAFVIAHLVITPILIYLKISPQLISTLILDPVKWLVMAFGISYLSARGLKGNK